MLKYDNTVSSQVDGKPIYGAQVTVYTADTNTPSLATIFADEAGTTPLSQPILTDQLGYFAFYIGDGKYNIRVMTGAVEISRTNITMVDTLQLKQRALIVPVNEDGGTLPPADQRQGKLLGFDSGGNPTMAVPNSFEGPTGPANSTYTTLAGLKAAAVSNASYIFAPPSGSDGGAAAGTFLYQTAGAPYTADGVNVIQLDAVPLTTGALVRQASAGIAARRAAIGAIIRSAQREFDDAVKITQFGAVGGDKAKDTAGFNAAVTFAWTRGRVVEIPQSDVPFIFDKIVLPANETGVDGDPARPTKFTICGAGAVQFNENGFLFDAPASHYFYDLMIAGELRFFSTAAGTGSKFINGDKFIRLTLTPGLNIRNFDWGIYSTAYLQTVRAIGVTHRGGNGAFIKAPMAYDCSITDNIVEFGTDGVVIDGNGDPAVHTCRIDNNVIEGMAGRGIVVGPCLATSIDGNYMEGNAGGEVFFTGTAAHKGLRFQCNSFQQTSARLAAGAYSAVWGPSLALPVLSGGNFCTGNLHDLTGTSGLLNTFGDYVPAGKNLIKPGVGRAITTDDFTLVSRWFDRSIWMDPYQQEVVFKGKFDSQGASPVICFGTNSPSNTPGAFERTAWAKGSVVHNVAASAPGDVSHWICVATGTPGSWRPGGLIPA